MAIAPFRCATYLCQQKEKVSARMQYLKENVEKRLLDAAREVFLRDGFARSSVRDIAAAAGVAVGNLYRYYPGKDALFCAVLRPVTDALEAMLREHHGSSALDVSEMFTERYLRATVGEYLALFQARRPLLQLLLQRAQGSSLEHFRRRYTLRATLLVKDWFRDVKRHHPEVNTAVSDFFIRMHCVWMFALFEEMLCDDAAAECFQQVIGEYVRFEIVGWRDIMQI